MTEERAEKDGGRFVLSEKDLLEKRAFWKTQPVGSNIPAVEHRKVSPLPSLPPNMGFRAIDLPSDLEDVYTLLKHNYVEDDDMMFRFEYSREFLAWQLSIPGSQKEWNIALYEASDTHSAIVGFISAARLNIRIEEESPETVVVNFLCLDKAYRHKRLAPLLIAAVTNKVNEAGIFKAVFTSGTVFPFKYSHTNYLHRIINGERLVAKDFCSYRDVLSTPSIPPSGRFLRRMTPLDLPRVKELYDAKYGRMKLSVSLTDEQLLYLLLPREDIVETLVLEEGGRVAEFVSFFFLHSRIIENNPDYSEKEEYVYTAYLYYYNGNGRTDIIRDVIKHLERSNKCDVLNCLKIEENTGKEFESLGFLKGEGNLNYYLFNWRVPEVPLSENGFIPF